MGVTIRDIAKEAGVSASTVSRVMNGNAAISEETRLKIQETMKRMNYHPNSRARNFANGITNTIALVIDAEDETTFSNTLFNRSVYAIERIAQKNGYNLLITNDADETKHSISTLVYEKKADGLILPSSSVREKLLDMLQEEQFPFVVLGEPDICRDTIAWVDVDNYEGSRTAVRHLTERGYRGIAFLTEGRDTVFARRREAGYCDALKAAGIAQSSVFILDGCCLEATAARLVDSVRKHRTDAVICSNNLLAYQVLKMAAENGISIPEELGVVTFDNYPLAEYMSPPLTVIDIDTYRLGEEAAELLIGKISSDISSDAAGKRVSVIDTRIICRKSSEREGWNE